MNNLPVAFMPLEATDALLAEGEIEPGDPGEILTEDEVRREDDWSLNGGLGPLSDDERIYIENRRIEAEALADVLPPAPPQPTEPPKPTLRERVEPIRRVYRRIKGNSVDLAINALTILGVLAAIACLLFLVVAGTAAYGRNPFLAGLDVWYAVVAAGTCYAAIYVAVVLQRLVARRNAPGIHANDLMYRR